MQAISSGHYSHDTQVADAMSYLASEHPTEYARILVDFPEWESRKFGEFSSWLDTEAMGVDPEYSSWLADAIEATGLVQWFDGEPYAGPFNDEDFDQ